MNLVLGVDGGNSKTFALVANAKGCLLGFGQTGGSNHEGVGFAEAEKRLHQVAHEALEKASVDGPVAFGFWGIS